LATLAAGLFSVQLSYLFFFYFLILPKKSTRIGSFVV